MGIVIKQESDADILEVIDTLQAPRRFPSRLQRREQKRGQSGHDGDRHQELDQRAARACRTHPATMNPRRHDPSTPLKEQLALSNGDEPQFPKHLLSIIALHNPNMPPVTAANIGNCRQRFTPTILGACSSI